MLKLTILASGSRGNCALVESNGTKLLIDAGISARQIQRKLELMNVNPETLSGILVTHEHGDHVCGLEIFHQKFKQFAYCNEPTLHAISGDIAATVSSTGFKFEIRDVQIETFSVPHDAIDPVGFVLTDADSCLGIVTDLGAVTKSVLKRLEPCTHLMIESNYDDELLKNDQRRPYSVKQRTLSRHGHLSNKDAAAAIASLGGGNLKEVTLCHLSRDCNTPELVMRAVQDAENESMAGIKVSVADPD